MQRIELLTGKNAPTTAEDAELAGLQALNGSLRELLARTHAPAPPASGRHAPTRPSGGEIQVDKLVLISTW